MTVDEALRVVDVRDDDPDEMAGAAHTLAAEVKRLRGQLAVETIPVQLELNRKLHEEVERLREVAAEDYGYAGRLFLAFAPQCVLLDDLSGVLTQLDNCMAGMREENARLGASLAFSVEERIAPPAPRQIPLKCHVCGDGPFTISGLQNHVAGHDR